MTVARIDPFVVEAIKFIIIMYALILSEVEGVNEIEKLFWS
jgi:hypothetical protein